MLDFRFKPTLLLLLFVCLQTSSRFVQGQNLSTETSGWLKKVSEKAHSLRFIKLKGLSQNEKLNQKITASVQGALVETVLASYENMDHPDIDPHSGKTIVFKSGDNKNQTAYCYKWKVTSQNEVQILFSQPKTVGAIFFNGEKMYLQDGFVYRDEGVFCLPCKPGLNKMTIFLKSQDVSPKFKVILGLNLSKEYFEILSKEATGGKKNGPIAFVEKLSKSLLQDYYSESDLLAEGLLCCYKLQGEDIDKFNKSFSKIYRINEDTATKVGPIISKFNLLTGDSATEGFLKKNNSSIPMRIVLTGLSKEGRDEEAVQLYNNIKKFVKGRPKQIKDALFTIGHKMKTYGQLESAQFFLKEAEAIDHQHKSKHIAEDLSAMSTQGASAFTQDVEAESLYFEIAQVIKGEASQESCSKVYTVLRKNAHKMYTNGRSMISLRFAIMDFLNKNREFKKVFELYTKTRLTEVLEKLKAKSAFDELENLMKSFTGFCDLSETHQFLAREYLDIGKLERAYRHCKILENVAQYKKWSLVYILLIENTLKFPQENQTRVPVKLKGFSFKFKGKPFTLGEFEKVMSSPESHDHAPGSFINSLLLPDYNQKYNSAIEWNRGRRIQPIEPSFDRNSFYLGSPSSIVSADLKSGKINWRSERAISMRNVANKITLKHFSPFVRNGKIFQMQSRAGLNGYSIQTMDINGVELWDSRELNDSKKWQPYCTPFAAYEHYFSLVLSEDRNNKNAALIKINPENGSYEILARLNIEANRLESHRFNQHFAQGQNALYGQTGTGVIFRIDMESDSLRWCKAFRTVEGSSGYSIPGPAFTQPFKNTVVGYLPEMTKVVGLNNESGQMKWEWPYATELNFHSRGNNQQLIVSEKSIRQLHALKSVSPDTGKTIWTRVMRGSSITGEGVTRDGVIYIPIEEGIATYRVGDGKSLGVLRTPFVPDKIRYNSERWFVFSDKKLHLFSNSGKFNPSEVNHSLGSKEKQPKRLKEVDALGWDRLYIEKVVANPLKEVRQGIQPYCISTSLPYYKFLKINNEIALIREGHLNSENHYLEPAVVWANFFPRAHLDGIRVCSSQNEKATLMDGLSRDIIAEYNKPFHSTDRILDAQSSGNYFVVLLEKKIKIIDLTTKEIFDVKGDSVKRFSLNNDRLVMYSLGKKQLTIYDMKNKKTLFQVSDKSWVRAYALKVEENYVIFRTAGSSSFLVDMRTGKKKHFKKSGIKFYWNEFVDEGKYYVKGAKTCLEYDIKTEKKTVFSAMAKAEGGGVLLLKKGETTFRYHGSEYKIEGNFKHLMDGSSFDVAVFGDKVVIYSPIYLWVYSMEQKRIIVIHKHQFYPKGKYNPLDVGSVYILNRSLLRFDKNWLSFASQSEKLSQLGSLGVRYQVLDKSSSRAWPEEGVYAKQDLSEHWLSYAGKTPTRSIKIRSGYDHYRTLLNLELSAKTERDTTFLLKFSAIWPNRKHLEFLWNLDIQEKYIPIHDDDFLVKCWKEVSPSGKMNAWIEIKPKEGGRMEHPLYGLDIENQERASVRGSYRYGYGFAPFHEWRMKGAIRQVKLEKSSDYKIREKLYSETHGFFPSGYELATFMRDRRYVEGKESNLKFLTSLLNRCKDSLSAINVLSTLFLEKIEAMKSSSNLSAFCGDEFEKAVEEIAGGLRIEAKNLGIEKSRIDMALSRLTWTLYPHPRDGTGLYREFDIYRKEAYEYLPVGRGELLSPYLDRPENLFIFPGFFSAEPASSIKDVRSKKNSMSSVSYGPMSFFISGTKKEFFSTSGNDKIKLKGIWDKKSRKYKDKEVPSTRYSYGEKSYPSYASQGRFRFKNIKFEIKQKSLGLKAEELLWNLNHLPSDSQSGLEIIDSYLAISKGKGPSSMDLYEVLLHKISNSIDVVPAVFARMLALNELNSVEKNKFLKSKMKEFDIDKTIQRKTYLQQSNAVEDHARWLVLGDISKTKLDSLTPLPEDVGFQMNIPYKSGTTEYKFSDGTDLFNKKKWRGQTRYLAGVIDSKRKKRVYLFYQTTKDMKISIWLNGMAKILSALGPKSEQVIRPLVLQLNKGRNAILIKVSYGGGERFEMIIGDSRGAILEKYQVKRP